MLRVVSDLDDEVLEFLSWEEDLNSKDLLHAFRSIKKLERIKFEMITKSEGYMERIENEVKGWNR